MKLFMGCLFAVSLMAGAAGATPPGMGAYLVSPQQIPVGDSYAAVPATQSTLIWVSSPSVRVLRIVPNTTTCTMECDATAQASANSTPIPTGWVFNLAEPPPTMSCYAYCTAATTIAVSPGN